MAIKISHDENGRVVTIDSKTGQKEEIGTMESLMSEMEEKRKLREKAKKLLEEQRKHPSK